MPQKVLRDPIYGDIALSLPEDSVLLELIDTASFQRLRRINQLGVSYLAFHGAEHSRFTHSLGTMHLMTLAIDHLIREAKGTARQQLLKYRQIARIASLLHDIGHGPFSHNFEQILPHPALPHEQWGIKIVTGDTDIARVLLRNRIKPADIANIIAHRFTVCPAIQELLSGHLDVDRMDYLLRDSHATGVKYGIFDWERLLRSLTTYSKRKKLHLALTSKGVHALEEFILARYFMYDQVYLHKTALGAEFLLKMILKRASERNKGRGADNTVFSRLLSNQKLTVHEYLTLDDTILISSISQWSTTEDSILADLCNRFLSRKLFVSLPATSANRNKLFMQATRIAKAKGFDPQYYVGMLGTSLAAYPLRDLFRNKLDLVVMTPKGPKHMSAVSPVIKQFNGKTFGATRVCFPREIRNSI